MDSIRNLDKLIKDRPANAALDYSVVTRVIREVVKEFYPDIDSIASISHETYKRRVGRHHSAFNYGYTVHGIRHDGSDTKLLLIYSAHTDGSRSYAYDIMHQLIAAGFNDGPFRIIRPLVYRDDLQALIYEGTPGHKLFTYMQQHAPVADIVHAMGLVAAWIRKFHTQQVTSALEQSVRVFDWRDMNKPLATVLHDVEASDPVQGDKLAQFIEAFAREEARLNCSSRRALVYGDLHPENVIIPDLTAQDLTMIDFTDVTLGDQLRDVGTFIQQIHFMGRSFYSDTDRDMIVRAFLTAYFGADPSTLADIERARINLFQAWNALRSFVYFFYLGSSKAAAFGLLEDAWRFLYLAEQRINSFSITY